jgi:hypothetical protein
MVSDTWFSYVLLGGGGWGGGAGGAGVVGRLGRAGGGRMAGGSVASEVLRRSQLPLRWQACAPVRVAGLQSFVRPGPPPTPAPPPATPPRPARPGRGWVVGTGGLLGVRDLGVW